MAIKKTVRRKAAKKSTSKGSMAMPTEWSEAEDNPLKYVYLLYGRSGIGKTTLCASFPKAVFLSTEPGTKGLRRKEFNADDGGITDWALFRSAVDILVADKGKQFDTVVIDTMDNAYNYCQLWTCEQLGIKHVSEDKTGKSDRSGKGWTKCKTEFTDQLYRLVNAGYGLVLTSHSKVTSIETHSGEEYDFIQPSMAGQAITVARSITDCIFYCEFAKVNGKSQRIMITEGDELVMAKHRGTWPKYLPMELKDGFKVVADAFAGKHKGIDIEDIRSSKQTEGSAGASLSLDRSRERRKGKKK